ncbi:MAG: choice-of-anchor J domain-containing protein, partial [Candidatus Marinimicrobia bacterium]|nr:choice-of-anchor J domain-containing protein [Candidatus Neomarinimicrobiota bacterium]
LEEPKWHLSTHGSHDGSEVWWCGDSRASWGGYSGYGNGWLQYLNTNPIDLTGTTTPQLTYQTAWAMEADWDGGTVFISTDDGVTWTELIPTGGYPEPYLYSWNYHWNGASDDGIDFGTATAGNHGGYSGHEDHVGDNWTVQTVDLAAYIGETVIVRFALAADACYSSAASSCEDYPDGGGAFDGGWWLDDIVVDDSGANLVTDLTPTQEGAGFTGDDPWIMLDYYYDTAGGVSESHSYNITSYIIGSYADSLNVRWTAIFDGNDDGNIAGTDTDWGFEVVDAKLRVTTRFETDGGASFVDLVDSDGDSVLSADGYALVGETYDPVTTIQNYGLTDINIYSAFVEIENNFGDLVYQRFIYTYAPGQGDTLFMYPGYQEFNDSEAFNNFPDWTCAYEGDYILRAYFQVFGGDDEPLDDAIEIPFHAFTETPFLVENFNASADSLEEFGWSVVDSAGSNANNWFLGDLFGAGNPGPWIYYGPIEAQDEWLISPQLDLTGADGTMLLFQNHYYNPYSAATIGMVKYSVDDGLTWTSLDTFGSTTASAIRNGYLNYDISGADDSTEVRIAFHYQSPGDDYYWTVDDIIVTDDLGDIVASDTVLNLTAVAGDLMVHLTWDDVGSDVMYYNIYRSEDDTLANAGWLNEVSGTEYIDVSTVN